MSERATQFENERNLLMKQIEELQAIKGLQGQSELDQQQ